MHFENKKHCFRCFPSHFHPALKSTWMCDETNFSSAYYTFLVLYSNYLWRCVVKIRVRNEALFFACIHLILIRGNKKLYDFEIKKIVISWCNALFWVQCFLEFVIVSWNGEYWNLDELICKCIICMIPKSYHEVC